MSAPAEPRPRIAILASYGWGVRNVLLSRAMERLAGSHELLAVSPFNHVAGFRERFAHFSALEDLPDVPPTRWMRFFAEVLQLAFFTTSSSATHKHKLAIAERRGAKAWRRLARPIAVPAGAGGPRRLAVRARVAATRLGREAYQALVHALGRRLGSEGTVRLAKAGLRQSIRWTPRYRSARRWLRDARVSVLVSSNPGNPLEAPYLIAARDLRIPVLAIITSWDNVTSKKPYVVPFDRYLVWSELMAGEVAQYYGVDRGRVDEIGPLQFDYYFDESSFEERDAFLRRHGLDPARRTVVYSAVTPQLLPDEPQVVAGLLLALRAGRVRGAPNLIVRMHPKRPLEDFRSVMEDPRFRGLPVAWSVAGEAIRERNDRWCPLDREVALLTNTVRHGDVDVTPFSTMLLDFAVLGKPSVLVCHTGDDTRLHWESYAHLQPVLACQGYAVTHTLEQTLEALNAYLEKPELHAEGRARLLRLECGAHLGRAWERLAEVLAREARAAASG